MNRSWTWAVMVAAALWLTTGACQAQEFVSRQSIAGSKPDSGSKAESWWWVHSGVTMQVAGTFSDWATSWKQPEGNQWLSQGSGPYAGRFYREGTVKKSILAAGVGAASYLVAWKWPGTRKFVGLFNMTMGAGFAAAAVKNVAQNPYYKP